MTDARSNPRNSLKPPLGLMKRLGTLLILMACLSTPPLIADDPDELEDIAEEAAEDAAEEAAEEAAEGAAEEAAEEEAEEAAEDAAEEAARDEIEASIARSAVPDSVFEDFGERDLVVSQELLAMADSSQIDTLIRRSELTLVSRRELHRLPGELARFRVGEAYSPQQVRDRLRPQLPGASIDLNHGYRIEQAAEQGGRNGSTLAGGVYQLPDDINRQRLKIGMIDTDLDISHPAFSSGGITRRNFISNGGQQDTDHGTGVASLLVGQSDGFQGIAPGSELFAASVFARYPDRGLVATSHDLVAALDWLTGLQVNAINISLSGPRNQVVAAAIDSLAGENVILVAAVGNQGPFAEPRYPAAYERVIGVTAVDRDGRIYSQAGRGEHVDYAGPGVAVDVAKTGGGFTRASGTSYATPLITGLLLAYQLEYGSRAPDLSALESLIGEDVLDLGQPGRDPLYGRGLPGRAWIAKTLNLAD